MKKVQEEKKKEAELKFIDKNELRTIKKRQDIVDKYIFDIGIIESQKHALLHELSEANRNSEAYKEILKDKYGSINVNMIDGSYTPISDGQ